MNKKIYVTPEMKLKLYSEDIVRTSLPTEDNELPPIFVE